MRPSAWAETGGLRLTIDLSAAFGDLRRAEKRLQTRAPEVRLEAVHPPIHRTRGRIEKVFGAWNNATAFAGCDGPSDPCALK